MGVGGRDGVGRRAVDGGDRRPGDAVEGAAPAKRAGRQGGRGGEQDTWQAHLLDGQLHGLRHRDADADRAAPDEPGERPGGAAGTDLADRQGAALADRNRLLAESEDIVPFDACGAERLSDRVNQVVARRHLPRT